VTRLLVVGGGLFGSLAAAYARLHGREAVVFDPGLPGAASPAAAGLFCAAWTGRKHAAIYPEAVAVLEALAPVRDLVFEHPDGSRETIRFVPPSAILEPAPIHETVTDVGDGWLVTESGRHEGLVYVAAGIWSRRFADIDIVGKAGAAFRFAGETPARLSPGERRGLSPPKIRSDCTFPEGINPSARQSTLAFVREPGSTYFNDGTAEVDYGPDHERRSLERAGEMGLTEPIERLWGIRPYTPGGPVFRRLGSRTWLATGGRKLGTLFGAVFARRLMQEMRDAST
jgi:glycine/D-amino acid oxidase-like deaminating enzyme